MRHYRPGRTRSADGKVVMRLRFEYENLAATPLLAIAAGLIVSPRLRCERSCLGVLRPGRCLEGRALRIFPDRGKRVGLAWLKINTLWTLRLVNPRARADGQHMLSWGQRCLVSFVNPQIRNFDAVDEQVDVVDGSEIR